MAALKLVLLGPRRLGDFERLLSAREFGGCFCAYWTSSGDGFEERCKSAPQENLEAVRRLVRSGGRAGYLVFREDDGATVAWTAAGPKTAFPRLKSEPGGRLGRWSDDVWAVACLSVAFPYRGLGYARATLGLVADEARAAGARALEGYPADPSGEQDAYRGSKAFYEAAGFTAAESEQDGGRRILRMELAL